MKKTENCEILIIGAGIVGLTIARELLGRGLGSILILEKESELGAHASGRNSGVIHAGVYYGSDSLKAKFCKQGNDLLRDYCRRNQLPLFETGKVIVTKNNAEVPVLDLLIERADAAGAAVEKITPSRLKEIEPYAKTVDSALHVKNTAVLSPIKVLECLKTELMNTGKVQIRFSEAFKIRLDLNTIQTSLGNSIQFKHLINASGGFADQIAHHFSVGHEYRTLPFKGTYLELKPEKSDFVHGNIYPVPNLKTPFLGVHFTKGATGKVYIGPTAIPVFGRENYSGIQGLGKETLGILARDAILMLTNSFFRNLAFQEIQKYRLKNIFSEASKMLDGISIEDLVPSKKVGIRPQLIHWPKRSLEMDFKILKAKNSTHILNAISPAFTTSMSFAKYVADEIGA